MRRTLPAAIGLAFALAYPPSTPATAQVAAALPQRYALCGWSLGGHVSMQYGGLASAPPYIKDGKVRAIAITGDKRDPAVPDVPTFKESGLEGVDVSSVWGLHAPPGTPIEIRRAVRDAVAAAMRDPEVAKQLAERGYQTIASTPEEHQKQTDALVNQWIEVGKKVNLKE